MRKYIFYIIGILLIGACSKDEIEAFNTTRQYLFFEKELCGFDNLLFFLLSGFNLFDCSRRN